MTIAGETLATGADPNCSRCRKPLTVGVLKSAAGYYIGTSCPACRPGQTVTRESDYYDTEADAEDGLVEGYSRTAARW